MENSEFKALVDTLKPYEAKWCDSMQAEILMLPNGYLVRDYNAETDRFIGSCFVPIGIELKATLEDFE